MSPALRNQLRLWLFVAVAIFAAIYVFRSVLLPFVAGMAVAYLLDPICDRLERAGLSRTLATSLVTLGFLVLVVLLLLLVGPLIVGQVSGFLERLPSYVESLRGEWASLATAVEARLSPEIMDKVREAVSGSAGRIVGWATEVLTGLVSGGVALANLLSLLFITPVVSFYLLRDWDRIVAAVDGWLPRDSRPVVRAQVGRIDETLAGWVRGQFTVCLVLGVFYAIGLTAAGLDFGLIIGLLAGLLSFIPFVGAIFGAIGSIGLALVQFDDWVRIAIVAAIFIVGQALEGNLLTPRLVGERVGLHPVWVIFALLAGSVLLGFVGLLLAVPLAATLGVLIRFLLERYLASDVYKGGGGEPPEAEPDP